MNFVTKTAFFFKKHLQGLYLFTSFHEFSGARTHKLFFYLVRCEKKLAKMFWFITYLEFPSKL